MREHRVAVWVFAAVAVSVFALVWSVWLVGANAADELRASEAKARAQERVATTTRLRAANVLIREGCARSVARDFESYATNRDLRDFARDAMRARRSSGDFRIAKRYEATAASAAFRMRRIRQRLPEREDEASVAEWCRRLYPEPAQ